MSGRRSNERRSRPEPAGGWGKGTPWQSAARGARRRRGVALDAVAVVDGEPEAADVTPEPELGATEGEADGATQAARLSSASAVNASRVHCEALSASYLARPRGSCVPPCSRSLSGPSDGSIPLIVTRPSRSGKPRSPRRSSLQIALNREAKPTGHEVARPRGVAPTPYG